jgi:predicted nucleotidyltransferase
MTTIIDNNFEKISLLFQNNFVLEAFVFGSIVSEKFNLKSDIDFIIKFYEINDPIEFGEKWWNVYFGLKNIFNREIDIIIEKDLTNEHFINEINKTKKKIYG